MAFYWFGLIRKAADYFSGYNENKMTEEQWINRFLFLESIGSVPGMVGGINIHLKSLYNLKDDRGVLHHMLEEAENERIHLFFFLNHKRPGLIARLSIALK